MHHVRQDVLLAASLQQGLAARLLSLAFFSCTMLTAEEGQLFINKSPLGTGLPLVQGSRGERLLFLQ